MAFNLNNIPENNPTKDYSFTLDTFLKKEISLFGSSLSSKKKYNFYNELAVLLKANITLKDALSLISKNQVKENDKLIFDGILEKILLGKSLSTAIKESKHFTNYEYPRFPNNFELTHTLSWAAIYEKNNFKIALGTKWTSGRPKTSPNLSQIDLSNPVLVYNKPNDSNLNMFSQVNLSSTYKWETADGIQYKIGISILNILNRRNEISEYYRINSLTNSIEEVDTFSLQRTPNLSFRVSF